MNVVMSRLGFTTVTVPTVTPVPATATVVFPETKFAPEIVTLTGAEDLPPLGVIAAIAGVTLLTLNGRGLLVPYGV